MNDFLIPFDQVVNAFSSTAAAASTLTGSTRNAGTAMAIGETITDTEDEAEGVSGGTTSTKKPAKRGGGDGRRCEMTDGATKPPPLRGTDSIDSGHGEFYREEKR